MNRPVEPPHDPARGHSHDRGLLLHEMLSQSNASIWEEARLEWSFFDAYEDASMTHCLCGHEIKERCVLRNRFTECLALVGSSCVREFMTEITCEVPTNAIFASLKRVKRSPDKAVHKHLVKLAREKCRITSHAENWYAKHNQKRALKHEETEYRRILNRRILGDYPETRDAAETAFAERFCMPYDGPWKLDEQLLQQACKDGRLTEWEVKFYTENYAKDYVSDKQRPIKRRIEELTLPTPWVLDEETLQLALDHRFITPWDHTFYLSSAQCQRFTSKQAVIKWRIEDKVRRGKQPAHRLV
jgi:hypothetical protein